MKLCEITVYHGTGAVPKTKLKAPLFVTKDPDAAAWFAVERTEKEPGVVLVGELTTPTSKILNGTTHQGYDMFLDIAKKAKIKFKQDPYFDCDEVAKHSPYDGTNVNDLIYIPAMQKKMRELGFTVYRTWDTLSNEEHETYILLDPDDFKITGHEAVDIDFD